MFSFAGFREIFAYQTLAEQAETGRISFKAFADMLAMKPKAIPNEEALRGWISCSLPTEEQKKPPTIPIGHQVNLAHEVAESQSALYRPLLDYLKHHATMVDHEGNRTPNDASWACLDKDYWQPRLQAAYDAILVDYHIQFIRDRKQNLPSLVEDLHFCWQVLESLQSANPKADAEERFTMPKDVPWWHTRIIIDILTYWNWIRLYLVWSVDPYGATDAAMAIWPLNLFFSSQRAMRRLHNPLLMQILGALSFVGYLIRGGIEFFLLFRHTFFPTEAERKLQSTWQQRLAAQWAQRWETIINDFVWALVNILTVYYLIDKISVVMGALGGILTIALMACDVVVAIFAFIQQRRAHQRALIRLNDEIAALEKGKNGDQKQQAAVQVALAQKQQERDQLQFDWYFTRQRLLLNLVITTLFLVSIVFIFAPAFPVLIPSLLWGSSFVNQLVFWGSLASVLITTIETVGDYQIDKQQCQVTLKAIETRRGRIQALDKTALQANEPKHEWAYLADQETYQRCLWRYYTVRQLYTIVTQLGFPLVVLSAMMALPTLWMVVVIVATGLAIFAGERLLGNLKPECQKAAEVTDIPQAVAPANVVVAEFPKTVEARAVEFSSWHSCFPCSLWGSRDATIKPTPVGGDYRYEPLATCAVLP